MPATLSAHSIDARYGQFNWVKGNQTNRTYNYGVRPSDSDHPDGRSTRPEPARQAYSDPPRPGPNPVAPPSSNGQPATPTRVVQSEPPPLAPTAVQTPPGTSAVNIPPRQATVQESLLASAFGYIEPRELFQLRRHKSSDPQRKTVYTVYQIGSGRIEHESKLYTWFAVRLEKHDLASKICPEVEIRGTLANGSGAEICGIDPSPDKPNHIITESVEHTVNKTFSVSVGVAPTGLPTTTLLFGGSTSDKRVLTEGQTLKTNYHSTHFKVTLGSQGRVRRKTGVVDPLEFYVCVRTPTNDVVRIDLEVKVSYFPKRGFGSVLKHLEVGGPIKHPSVAPRDGT